MPSFRSSKEKASHSIRSKIAHGSSRHSNKNSGQIHSLGTERNYTQSLKGVQVWLNENRLEDLKNLNSAIAERYLDERSLMVGQKTLDLDRQALQLLLGSKLGRVQSSVAPGRLATVTRAYAPEQVRAIAAIQNERCSLSTEIAHAAGLRAHELHTLRLASERPASNHREWSSNRFEGREGRRYTVVGKGGLVTEKIIPHELATRIEVHRLSTPQTVRDRGINYEQHYDIAGGKKWSEAFTKASKEALGFSNGGHGLRHSYAQEREAELQSRGYAMEEARGITAQEMGHFSPDTTRSYER